MDFKKIKKIAGKIIDFLEQLKRIPDNIKRFFYRRTIKNRDFTVISNNCWAGKVYQYLDMPYLSPTVGLYFFAEDYIKFVSDLRRYLSCSLRFIEPEESKYYDELKRKGQTDKPIGILDDVEIVFLHYSSKEEACEKWNRRKSRVNYDNIILKFARMNLCTEKELEAFDALDFPNKFMLNDRKPVKYASEIYWGGNVTEYGIKNDTSPFPGTIKLKKILDSTKVAYPQDGLNLKKGDRNDRAKMDNGCKIGK